MRYPESNSRSEKILMAFLRGPMTIYQGAEIHGEFATPRLPGGIDHAKMVELYADLVERGCLVRDGIKYKLSVRAADHIRRKVEPAPALQIVPPRVRSILSEPLRRFFRNGPWHYAI